MRLFPGIALCLLSLILMMTGCGGQTSGFHSAAPVLGKAGDLLLRENLDYLVAKYDIPGLGAMSVKSGEILESGQSGIRRTGTADLITGKDKWHLGSITKAMTATLTAILVERGQLSWDTTIGETVEGEYREEYAGVTVFDLLTHTSRVTTQDLLFDIDDPRPVTEVRLIWTLEALNMPPRASAGFSYSNNNYVIAGTMLEIITGQSWEQLMRTHLFQPLEMDDTGFGAPGRNDGFSDDGASVDISGQPWGHRQNHRGWTAISPALPAADNPEALGPAGTVHTTFDDLYLFIRLHMGDTQILSPESLAFLHADANGTGYAPGWNVGKTGIFHAGSNTLWFAQLFLSKTEDLAIFAATNCYDRAKKRCVAAVQEAMQILGKRYSHREKET